MKTVFTFSQGATNITFTATDIADGTAPARRYSTAARRAVARAAASYGRSFTARELHAALRDERPVGLTTVYRTLALFVDEGLVREAGQRGGERLYAACEVQGHHHHLVCESCGAVEESTICGCEELERALGREHGFVLSRQERNYFGLCAACVRGR